MTSNIIHCEQIEGDRNEITAIQLDEEHHATYALTNDRLSRIDLNNNKNDVQIVYQHKRPIINDDDEYSQGESDDEDLVRRVSDPFEDSEPSTDDDEDTIND